MKGLILKELYFLRDSLTILIVSMIVIGIGSSFVINPTIYLIIFPILLGSVVLTSINKDRNSKWARFVATMPMPRNSIMRTKFIIYLFTVITGILIGLIAVAVAILFKDKIGTSEIISSLGLGVTISLISGAISIPINFLWSEERALMAQILSYTCIALLMIGIMYGLNKFIPVNEYLNLIFLVLSIISIITYIISCLWGLKRSMRIEY